MTPRPHNAPISLPDVRAGQRLLWECRGRLVNVQARENARRLPPSPGYSDGWLLVVVEAGVHTTGIFQADGRAVKLWEC